MGVRPRGVGEREERGPKQKKNTHAAKDANAPDPFDTVGVVHKTDDAQYGDDAKSKSSLFFFRKCSSLFKKGSINDETQQQRDDSASDPHGEVRFNSDDDSCMSSLSGPSLDDPNDLAEIIITRGVS